MILHLEPDDVYKSFIYTGAPIKIGEFSAKKLPFKCKCGSIKLIRMNTITTGKSTTCGECSKINLNYGTKFNDLIYIGPSIRIHPQSEKKLLFKCKCGKSKYIRFFTVEKGKAKKCGDCNLTVIKKGDKIGNFWYAGNEITEYLGTIKKYPFKCKCGKIVFLSLRNTKKNQTCGKCNEILLKHMEKYQTFVYLGKDIHIGPWSKTKLPFKCRCGALKYISISSITCGDTVSCTNCYQIISTWYKNNVPTLKKLKCPISPSQFPIGGPIPLETIKFRSKSYTFLCPICDSQYNPTLNEIVRGKRLTCGCICNKISVPNREIKNFIDSLNLNSELEFKLDGRYFDIKSGNLLIELNGIRWHSKINSRQRDTEKYSIAMDNDYQLLSIFEDEWKNKKQIFKNIIQHNLVRSESILLRPQKCEILKVQNKEINDFYERTHYIGKCKAKVHYAVIHDSKIIAAMSFGKPTRPTKRYDWEIIRIATDPNYHVHGIWSKLLKLFIKEYKPKSIVSFSDNRLFTGKVYEKLGFTYDGDVKPDYYWTLGNKRFHKSNLRKTKEEKLTGLTETQLREAQGYKKIWDLGKKRWVYQLIDPSNSKART